MGYIMGCWWCQKLVVPNGLPVTVLTPEELLRRKKIKPLDVIVTGIRLTLVATIYKQNNKSFLIS
jgi:hypothetical protein